jgi:predicted MPP superfamily phosphohydrolase
MKKENMTYATFLHLSDFHCKKGNNRDACVPFNECIKDIEKWCCNHKEHKIDAILISGDIAFSGHSDEYDLAIQMLKRITDATGVKKQNIFLVPGNHDVDFDKINKPEEETIQSILEGRSKIDEYFTKYEDYKIFLEKFKAYSEFVDSVGNSFSSWKRSGTDKLIPWYSIQSKINGINFRIIGLITSLLTNKKEIAHGSIHVGKYQIQEVLIPQKDEEFVIMLSHHPIDWMDEEESWALQVLIGKEKTIYLHGHSHHHRSYYTSFSPEIEYRSISAGAMYSGSDYRNKYHIFQIDSSKQELRLWPREWKPDAVGWRPDSDWRDLDADDSWSTTITGTYQVPGVKRAHSVLENFHPYRLTDKPLSFCEFPEVLTQTSGNSKFVDLAIVIGSGRYLHSDHVSYGTDCLGIPEIVALLKDKVPRFRINSYLDIDLYKTKNLQDKNLLIIGSGKVNFVTMKLLERFGNALKFKFTPLYNVILSNAGREKIYRDGQGKDFGLGIVCLTVNPWAADANKHRIALLLAGFHPLGSIAATDLLRRYIIKREIRENNRFDRAIPMKIVRGAPIEFSKYHRRISDVILNPINTPTYIGNINNAPQILE